MRLKIVRNTVFLAMQREFVESSFQDLKEDFNLSNLRGFVQDLSEYVSITLQHTQVVIRKRSARQPPR